MVAEILLAAFFTRPALSSFCDSDHSPQTLHNFPKYFFFDPSSLWWKKGFLLLHWPRDFAIHAFCYEKE
ncbi:Uncharacterized protein TCM_043048 [Theobroma cacao]|uniref:Secreted protein n=1 Tax=Theobroma cacao TaxID=3641 RepID=A0A061FP87_THECC|nr:Uncharacterized protein TCM_043048 [Theobroma cacao]